MAEFEKLIERLEKLTGPCRETDAYIASAAGLPMTFCDFDTGCYHGDCNSPGCGKPLGLSDERKSYPRNWQDDERLPYYTSSIDSALMLVGPDWHVLNLRHMSETEWFCGLAEKFAESEFANEVEAKARTPAIALCIASLRARLDKGE